MKSLWQQNEAQIFFFPWKKSVPEVKECESSAFASRERGATRTQVKKE
jgi:hypothetical protein